MERQEVGSDLALLGGPKAVQSDPRSIFDLYPAPAEVDEAVLEVLRAGKMSGLEVTLEFEKEYAKWLGVEYALGHNTGTAALHSAMFGVNIGYGDEIICQSLTYWASVLQVYSLGGTVVFADIDPDTLCIDPNDIENRITARTKAIMVVHNLGMPADMDPIMKIAKRHNLSVIEDGSHAHGALYKGRMVGSIGDVAGFSIMSGKPLHCGEGGVLTTDNRRIYERAVAFGHYARHSSLVDFTFEDLKTGAGLPWGGYKYRMHQLTSAMARVQLKYYPKLLEEMNKAMNYFWDILERVPGIKAHRPPKGSGTTKNWYAAIGLYRPEELGGLSVQRFCEAVRAEGVSMCQPGAGYRPLHLHPLFNTLDVYHQGKPTRIANLPSGVDIRQPLGSLPVTEGISRRVFKIPWFKCYRREIIEEYACAYKKVAEEYEALLPGDTEEVEMNDKWGTFLST